MYIQYVLTPLHYETAVQLPCSCRAAAVQTTNRHSQDRWPKLICQLGAWVSNCTKFLYELNSVFYDQDQKRIGLFLKVYLMKRFFKFNKAEKIISLKQHSGNLFLFKDTVLPGLG
jgi:hypothetical protein